MNQERSKLVPPTEDEVHLMLGRIKDTVKRKKQRRLLIKSGVSAVAIILATTFGTLYYESEIKDDIYLADTSDLKITLPDSSVVTLLRGARLTVRKDFPKDTRDVYLKGDALFKIAKSKDHPFIVHGQGYETKVLGTVFKVTQTAKAFNVDLYEGKVQVVNTQKPTEVFVLHPKETFSNMGRPEIALITKKSNEVSVTAIDISFKECPVDQAINTLEKTYGVSIRYPQDINLESVSITRQNAKINEIIMAIALQFNLNIKKINAKTFELEK